MAPRSGIVVVLAACTVILFIISFFRWQNYQLTKTIMGDALSKEHKTWSNHREELEGLHRNLKELKVGIAANLGAPPIISLPKTGTPKKKIMSLLSGKCLDYNLSVNATYLQLWKCHPDTSEQLKNHLFTIATSGQIRHEGDKCADATNVYEGGNVKMTPCTADSKGQQWEVVSTTSDDVGLLQSKANGLCIMPVTEAKSQVILRPCSNNCTQMWVIGDMKANIKTAKSSQRNSAAATTLTKPGGRILCWILTMPSAHDTKATAVNNTWGRDCDILLFASTSQYPGLNIIELDLGVNESRSALYAKSQHMWMYVYKHYLDQADWFIKADDDTYIVFPYLRNYLATFNHREPIHLGRRFHSGGRGDEYSYYSGGAGIILSHEAVRRLGDKATKDPSIWAGDLQGAEDYLTSQTLRKVGVYTMDTRDKDGAHQFNAVGLHFEHTSSPEDFPSFWLWKISKDARGGQACCSKRWITAHYVEYTEMYIMHYLRLARCQSNTDAWPYLDAPELH